MNIQGHGQPGYSGQPSGEQGSPPGGPTNPTITHVGRHSPFHSHSETSQPVMRQQIEFTFGPIIHNESTSYSYFHSYYPIHPRRKEPSDEVLLQNIMEIFEKDGMEAAYVKWCSLSAQDRCSIREKVFLRTPSLPPLQKERSVLKGFSEIEQSKKMEFLNHHLFQPIKENRIQDAAAYWESLSDNSRKTLFQETISHSDREPSQEEVLLQRFIFSRLENIKSIDPNARKHYVGAIDAFSMRLTHDQMERMRMLVTDQVLTMIIGGDTDQELLYLSKKYSRAICDGCPSILTELSLKNVCPRTISFLKDFQQYHRFQMRRRNIPCPLDLLPENRQVRFAALARDHYTRMGSLEVGPLEGVDIMDLRQFMSDAMLAKDATGADVVPLYLDSSEDGRHTRDSQFARVAQLLDFIRNQGTNQAHRDYIHHVLQHLTRKINQRVEAANGDPGKLCEIYTELWPVFFIDLAGADRHCIDRKVQTARSIWRTRCVDPASTTLDNQVITWLAAKREEIVNKVILEYVVHADPHADHASMIAAYKHKLGKEFGLSQTLQNAFFHTSEDGEDAIKRQFHAHYNNETIYSLIAEEYAKPAEEVHPAFNYQTIRDFLAERIPNLQELERNFFDYGEDDMPLPAPRDAIVAMYLQELGIISMHKSTWDFVYPTY